MIHFRWGIVWGVLQKNCFVQMFNSFCIMIIEQLCPHNAFWLSALNTLRKHGYNTNQLIWFHLHQEVRGKDGLQKKIKFWNLLKKILDVLHEAYVLLHDQLTAGDWKDPGNVFGSSVEMEDEGVNISDWGMLDCFAFTWKLFWEGTEET